MSASMATSTIPSSRTGRPRACPPSTTATAATRMSEAEIEEVIDGFVAAGAPRQGVGLRRHRAVRRLSRAHRPVLDAVLQPPRRPLGRQPREPHAASPRRSSAASASAVGDDFIIGLAVNLHPEIAVSLSIEAHAGDHRLARRAPAHRLCDLRHRQLFRLHRHHPQCVLRRQARRPLCRGAEAGGASTPGCRPRAISARRRMPTTSWPPGQADMVSIVRGQIADPHLANKARDGRAEDIRPCLSCNQMCWGRRYRDYWISCLINPSAGREFEWGGDRFTPAARPEERAGGRRRRRRARSGAGCRRARPSA